MSDDKTYNQVDSTTALKVRKQPQPGDVLDSIYRLEQPLGKGGVGVVYKAWHLHLQRPCAIKFLHPQLVSNPELRTRFRREAQSAFQLGHPHIVAITDFRDDPEAWPYLVMELVEGETLRDRLERGPLPPVLAVTLMAELCDALATAHRRGVIHRDLKPENLFLTRVDTPGAGDLDIMLKVLDFGLSKLLDGAEITGVGRLLGSPSYMSPEQARGDSHLVDARSDIFAVGALLYECLTGDKLFNAENFEQKRQMIIAAKLPPLKLMERGLPPQLEKIISKACARLPEERYQSASRLMDALHNVYPRDPRFETGRGPAVPARSGESSGAVAPVKLSALDASSTASSVGGGELVSARPDALPQNLAAPGTVDWGETAAKPKAVALRPAILLAGALGVAVVVVGAYAVISAGSRKPSGKTDNSGDVVAARPGSSPGSPPGSPVDHPAPVPTPVATPVAAPGPGTDSQVVPAVTTGPAHAAEPGTRPGAHPIPPVRGADDPPDTHVVASSRWRRWLPDKRTLTLSPPSAAPEIPVPHSATSSTPSAPEPEAASTTAKAVPTVKGVMTKAQGPLLRCFPSAPGKISVEITVGADGRVAEANVEGAEEHASCVLGVMRSLRFAPPTDGDSYVFTYDFVGVRH